MKLLQAFEAGGPTKPAGRASPGMMISVAATCGTVQRRNPVPARIETRTALCVRAEKRGTAEVNMRTSPYSTKRSGTCGRQVRSEVGNPGGRFMPWSCLTECRGRDSDFFAKCATRKSGEKVWK